MPDQIRLTDNMDEIDSDEQKDLNRMQVVIKKIEARLVKIKAKKEKAVSISDNHSPNKTTIQSKEEANKIMLDIQKEIKELLSALK